jgi:hypothetical protein
MPELMNLKNVMVLNDEAHLALELFFLVLAGLFAVAIGGALEGALVLWGTRSHGGPVRAFTLPGFRPGVGAARSSQPMTASNAPHLHAVDDAGSSAGPTELGGDEATTAAKAIAQRIATTPGLRTRFLANPQSALDAAMPLKSLPLSEGRERERALQQQVLAEVPSALKDDPEAATAVHASRDGPVL